MSKQAKGSIENPNIRASAKSGLNRFILQQSWEKFFELLELIQKTQAKFVCEVCKTEFHADYNASLNILNAVGTTVKAS